MFKTGRLIIVCEGMSRVWSTDVRANIGHYSKILVSIQESDFIPTKILIDDCLQTLDTTWFNAKRVRETQSKAWVRGVRVKVGTRAVNLAMTPSTLNGSCKIILKIGGNPIYCNLFDSSARSVQVILHK